MAHGLHENEGTVEHQRGRRRRGPAVRSRIPVGRRGGDVWRDQRGTVSTPSTARAALAPASWKPCSRWCAPPTRRPQPDNAVADEHHGGEYRVAGPTPTCRARYRPSSKRSAPLRWLAVTLLRESGSRMAHRRDGRRPPRDRPPRTPRRSEGGRRPRRSATCRPQHHRQYQHGPCQHRPCPAPPRRALVLLPCPGYIGDLPPMGSVWSNSGEEKWARIIGRVGWQHMSPWLQPRCCFHYWFSRWGAGCCAMGPRGPRALAEHCPPAHEQRAENGADPCTYAYDARLEVDLAAELRVDRIQRRCGRIPQDAVEGRPSCSRRCW